VHGRLSAFVEENDFRIFLRIDLQIAYPVFASVTLTYMFLRRTCLPKMKSLDQGFG